jgi:SAM-dependent methyltransferase
MSEPLPSRGDLSAPEARRVKQGCGRFEAAWRDWQARPRPALEGCLGGVAGPLRAVLLAELLRLELAYRRRAGEGPALAEYLARFPEDEGLLRAVFAGASRPASRAGRARLFEGLEPLSYVWGEDRGVPLCRYYLEQFLREFAADVRGRCLEFQADDYTTRLGGPAVTKVDVLHVDDSNPSATLVADLTKPNDLPARRFDCIVCTHVLHVVFELGKAVSELHRILRPGGCLLVAVPHVAMYAPGWDDLWRFSPEGLQRVLGEAFGASNVLVRAYGNSLTAAGQMRGLAAHEFTAAELDHHDPRFAVEVCARAVKKPRGPRARRQQLAPRSGKERKGTGPRPAP